MLRVILLFVLDSGVYGLVSLPSGCVILGNSGFLSKFCLCNKKYGRVEMNRCLLLFLPSEETDEKVNVIP